MMQTQSYWRGFAATMSRRAEQNTLEAFVIRIEKRLLRAGDTSTLENLVCRHLTNRKQPGIEARMIEKAVPQKRHKAVSFSPATGRESKSPARPGEPTGLLAIEADGAIESPRQPHEAQKTHHDLYLLRNARLRHRPR